MKYTKSDILITPKVTEGVIIKIEIVNSVDVFGDKTKDINSRLIQATVENAELNIKFKESFTYFGNGSVPDESKLGKFLDVYSVLEVSTRVKLVKNDKGFWKIEI